MRRLLPLAALALAAATPAAAQTTFDVTVKQIFAVSPDSIAKAEQLQTAGTLTTAVFQRLTTSRYFDRSSNGSTASDSLVRFTAVLLSDPLSSGLASAGANPPGRVHVFVRDVAAATDPAGMKGYVIQVVDGAYRTDGLAQLAPGAVLKLTGALAYFGGAVQFSPIALEVISQDYRSQYPDALGRPITVDVNELNKPAPADPAVQNPQATLNFANFPWSGAEYVRLEGLQVETNAAFGQRFNVTYANTARTTFIYQNDVSIRYRNDRNTDAGYINAGFNVRTTNYVPPAVGARVNVEGFTLPYTSDFVNYFNPNVSINISPIEDGDVQVLAGAPPSVANVRQTTAGLVRGTAPVSISADVAPSPDRTLSTVTLFYRPFGGGTYSSVQMTAGAQQGTSFPYTGSIPTSGLVDGSFVEYYVAATDNAGGTASSPTQSFRVLANGIRKIEHVQRPADSGTGASPFATAAFTAASGDFLLDAVVMSRPDTSGFVTVQDEATLAPWSGIWVEATTATRALRKGDRVQITGATVTEANGQTRLTGVTFTKTGTTTPYAYKSVTTTDLGVAATAEAHEGMALRLSNVTVISTNADAPSNFGEFLVASSGSSSNIRVDDFSLAIPDLFNSQLMTGQTLTAVQGLWDYSFSNYKLEPEVRSDLEGLTIDAEEALQIGDVAVLGVSPNPAVSAARVAFRTAATGTVRVDVYDVLGRRVATLVDGTLAAGDHSATLDASALSAGVYVVRLVQGTSTSTRTLVVR